MWILLCHHHRETNIFFASPPHNKTGAVFVTRNTSPFCRKSQKKNCFWIKLKHVIYDRPLQPFEFRFVSHSHASYMIMVHVYNVQPYILLPLYFSTQKSLSNVTLIFAATTFIHQCMWHVRVLLLPLILLHYFTYFMWFLNKTFFFFFTTSILMRVCMCVWLSAICNSVNWFHHSILIWIFLFCFVSGNCLFDVIIRNDKPTVIRIKKLLWFLSFCRLISNLENLNLVLDNE